MSFPTHERYDENEYFIKFKAIHPYLYYANDEYTILKQQFQIKLLDKLKKKEIDIVEFTNHYNQLIIKENNKSYYIESLKLQYKNKIKIEENNLISEIKDFMDFSI